MKIGIDIRPLQAETKYRGIGKSLENTLKALSKIKTAENVDFVFFMDSRLAKPEILKLFPGSTTEKITSSSIRRSKYPQMFFTAFKAISLKSNSLDVLWQPDAALGVPTNIPTLVIFYDTIPLIFKERERELEEFTSTYRRYKREIGRKGAWAKYLRMINSFKRAESITAISESSRRDLLKFLPEINENKTRVIYLGATKPNENAVLSDKAKKLGTKQYLLYVGGIDVRKNIIGLLNTYIELKKTHKNLKLVVVGKEFELDKQLEIIGWNKILRENKAAAQDVIMPGFLSDTDLHYLYKHAAAFVFPSRYEGFGLPVIEAMQLGCPVVAYDNSSIPEVAGNAALLVKDGANMAPTIDRLLNSKSLHTKLIKEGYSQAKKFTWEQTAKQTLDVLIELGNKTKKI